MCEPIVNERQLPYVFLPPEILSLIQGYIDLAPGEISGLGEVEVSRNDFVVTKLLDLLDQTVSNGSTNLDQDALFSFLEKAVEDEFDLSKVKLWWHSHKKGNVFWSLQDDNTISLLQNSGWIISIVGNQYGEYLARLDIFRPVHITLNLKISIIPQKLPRRQLAQLRAKIKQKVVLKPTVIPAVYTNQEGP